MKLILKTSNRTIAEKKELCDKHRNEDQLRSDVLNILITALAVNGIQVCGDSDSKWDYFETCILDQLRSCRKRQIK